MGLDAVTIVGFFGSLTSCMMFIPDAIRVIGLRHRPHDLIAVSLTAKAIAMTNSVLWIAYAVLIHAFWLGLPSSINILVNLVTVTVVTRSRNKLKRANAQALAMADTVSS